MKYAVYKYSPLGSEMLELYAAEDRANARCRVLREQEALRIAEIRKTDPNYKNSDQATFHYRPVRN